MRNYLDAQPRTTDTIIDRLGQRFRDIVEGLGQRSVDYVQAQRRADDASERARRASLPQRTKQLGIPRA
ncbi:MAG: hypothetical protein WBO49_00375 [Candidatus Saccharimonas sp.]